MPGNQGQPLMGVFFVFLKNAEGMEVEKRNQCRRGLGEPSRSKNQGKDTNRLNAKEI
ncbi:hypothetical protein ACFFMO_06705 [Lederbergia wuyishanensis]